MREFFGDEDLHVNVHDARGQVGLYNFLISTIWIFKFAERQILALHPPNTFNVTGKNDVILSSKSLSLLVQGARAGIEMKTNIQAHDLIQAKVECLLIAIRSSFPVIQFVCIFVLRLSHLMQDHSF